MSTVKKIITSFLVLIFLTISAYTVILRITIEVGADKSSCTDGLLSVFAPWSAGCFYKALFIEGDVSHEKLEFENQKLERFVANNGVSSQVLWYRLKFHQKYRDVFKTDFQVLHGMYQDYTESEHIKLELQAEYWHFLYLNDLAPLAQTTLDNYCDTYITSRRDDLVEEIRWRMKNISLPLSLDHCKSLVTPSD